MKISHNTLYRKVIRSIGHNKQLKKLLSSLFPKAYEKYANDSIDYKKNGFIKYGLEALQLFHNCMEQSGVEYTLAYGSILGAIREKGFIKHDMDIDTFVWFDDFDPVFIDRLIDAGFRWISHYSIDNDRYGREDTFEYKGVCIDVFYLYPPIKQYPYSCIFVPIQGSRNTETRMPRRVEVPVAKERKLIPFEDIEVCVPINAEEYCQFRYGPHYMTPDPTWDWANSGDYMTDWEEMIPYTTHTVNPRT